MVRLKGKKKNIIFAAAAVLMAFIFAYGLQGSLAQNKPYEPENEISSMDDERSQVFVNGSGYTLNENKQKEHIEAAEKRSKILKEREVNNQQTAAQKRMAKTRQEKPAVTPVKPTTKPKVKPSKPAVKPVTPTKPTKPPEKPTPPAKKPAKPEDTKKVDPDDEDEEAHYKKSDEEREKDPTIKTSLRDGITVQGETINFWVTATDYKKQNIPVFSNDEGSFTVLLNDVKLTSTGASGDKTNFSAPGQEGKNIIKITATDRKGNTRTITRRVNCETEAEPEPIGTVTVSISAPSLNIGTIAGGISVQIMEEEKLCDVLRDAFKAGGFSANMSDSYLKGISKGGIAKNAEITDEIREKAEEKRITIYEREKWPDGWQNRLYEKDFASTSGWIYRVNGDTPSVGINSYVPNDGDEIELIFILFEGDM